MERLTHERVNGIKTGYWSAATKEVLVQKLASTPARSSSCSKWSAGRAPARSAFLKGAAP